MSGWAAGECAGFADRIYKAADCTDSPVDAIGGFVETSDNYRQPAIVNARSGATLNGATCIVRAPDLPDDEAARVSGLAYRCELTLFADDSDLLQYRLGISLRLASRPDQLEIRFDGG